MLFLNKVSQCRLESFCKVIIVTICFIIMCKLSSFQFSIKFIQFDDPQKDCVVGLDDTFDVVLRTMNWSLGVIGGYKT